MTTGRINQIAIGSPGNRSWVLWAAPPHTLPFLSLTLPLARFVSHSGEHTEALSRVGQTPPTRLGPQLFSTRGRLTPPGGPTPRDHHQVPYQLSFPDRPQSSPVPTTNPSGFRAAAFPGVWTQVMTTDPYSLFTASRPVRPFLVGRPSALGLNPPRTLPGGLDPSHARGQRRPATPTSAAGHVQNRAV